MITTTGCNIDCISDNICLYQVGGGGALIVTLLHSVCLSHIIPPLYQRFDVTELWFTQHINTKDSDTIHCVS